MKKMKLKIMKSLTAHFFKRAKDKIRLKRTPPKNYDDWFDKIESDLLILKWMLGLIIVVNVVSLLKPLFLS